MRCDLYSFYIWEHNLHVVGAIRVKSKGYRKVEKGVSKQYIIKYISLQLTQQSKLLKFSEILL